MDKDYKMICSNEYMMVCEYQEEGYTKNINKEFVNNPFGYYMYFYEILSDMDMKGVSFGKRLYVIKLSYNLGRHFALLYVAVNIENFI